MTLDSKSLELKYIQLSQRVKSYLKMLRLLIFPSQNDLSPIKNGKQF